MATRLFAGMRMGQPGSSSSRMPNFFALSVFLPVVLPQLITAAAISSPGTVSTTCTSARTRSPL